MLVAPVYYLTVGIGSGGGSDDGGGDGVGGVDLVYRNSRVASGRSLIDKSKSMQVFGLLPLSIIWNLVVVFVVLSSSVFDVVFFI